MTDEEQVEANLALIRKHLESTYPPEGTVYEHTRKADGWFFSVRDGDVSRGILFTRELLEDNTSEEFAQYLATHDPASQLRRMPIDLTMVATREGLRPTMIAREDL